jgi:tRNA G18 (ribose-2'-O)-methylase SpoU
MKSRKLVLIAHDIRSCHNVGSLLRTADGLGINKVYLTGYTPYPKSPDDPRLPHLAEKMEKQIDKTALGAQNSVHWMQESKLQTAVDKLKSEGFEIAGLEQTADSIPISEFSSPDKLAVVVGNERYGLDATTLSLCDELIEIPMKGRKESFNVVVAAAIALQAVAD